MRASPALADPAPASWVVPSSCNTPWSPINALFHLASYTPQSIALASAASSVRYTPRSLIKPRATGTLAKARPRLLIYTSLILFVSVVLILASTRFGARVKTVFNHFNPPKFSGSLGTRPLVNVTMADPRYQKPPQAPPKFTATPESLIADTKRLVSHLTF
jgi:hypothetical protein